ncbi:MarR family transcriptional regulator [Sinorhizobium meliloti]|nr:MarR family transcriptional regulator [Sinorhizobium meliloti]
MTIKNLTELASQEPLDKFRISERWGRVADAGYQALPDVLLFAQSELRLSSEELNVLLNLLAHWWRPKDVVFPRATTIAERMGVSQRTVQRITKSLEGKGFIVKRRTEDRRPYYDVTPTKILLAPYAEKRLQEKHQAKQLKDAQMRSEHGQSKAQATDRTERVAGGQQD